MTRHTPLEKAIRTAMKAAPDATIEVDPDGTVRIIPLVIKGEPVQPVDPLDLINMKVP